MCDLLHESLQRYYGLAWTDGSTLAYLRQHKIDDEQALRFAGTVSVIQIADCGAGRFDFPDHGDGLPGIVCEAYDADGETVIDLVAWPVDRPQYVMTMFGRCGLLGLWHAENPATYIFDAPCQMFRTPLRWLQHGCQGAAVVTPSVAARILIDLPGNIAGEDGGHAHELKKLKAAAATRNSVVVPRRAA